MADISSYLQAILDAVYGEQVRGSIHDAIEIINEAMEVSIDAGTAVSSSSSSSAGFFEGSLYINTTTYDLWKCVGTNSWSLLGNVRGNGIRDISKTGESGNVDIYTITFDDGTTEPFTVTNGIDGANGSIWYKGTALTGTGTSITGFPGVINDFYLNSSTGYVYVCTKTGGATVPDAAEWDYVMTLTGGGGGSTIIVIDNLTSSSSTDALSANQGRVLKNLVDQKVNSADLAQVAFSGDFDDLENQPVVDQTYDPTSANAQSGVAIEQEIDTALSNKADKAVVDRILSRSPRDITSDIQADNGASLFQAIAEQNLEKYGYKIGDYFKSPSNRTLTEETYSSGTVTQTDKSVKIKYILADMDTYYGGYNSYAVVNTHHIGVVVDSGVNRQWAAAALTSGGYESSKLHTFLKGTTHTTKNYALMYAIQQDFTALFGGYSNHLLANNKLFETYSGTAFSWAWADTAPAQSQLITALTEAEVYGFSIWGGDDVVTDRYHLGEAVKHLELFRRYRFNQVLGDENAYMWLRGLATASTACNAGGHGYASYANVYSAARAVGLILLH